MDDEIQIPRTYREKYMQERERLYRAMYAAQMGYDDLVEGRVTSYSLGNRSMSRNAPDLKTLMDFIKSCKDQIDEIEAILSGRAVRATSTNAFIMPANVFPRFW
jgi:curli biogenesis system outer membrane secretion channel CsgG